MLVEIAASSCPPPRGDGLPSAEDPSTWSAPVPGEAHENLGLSVADISGAVRGAAKLQTLAGCRRVAPDPGSTTPGPGRDARLRANSWSAKVSLRALGALTDRQASWVLRRRAVRRARCLTVLAVGRRAKQQARNRTHPSERPNERIIEFLAQHPLGAPLVIWPRPWA